MSHGICHVTSAPYHPSTFALAERSVQTLKNGMKKGMGNDLQRHLSNFLFHYRTTPHTTTEVSPTELMMGWQLRTRLDLICLDVGACVVCKQWNKWNILMYLACKEKSFPEVASVFIQNFTTWWPTMVVWLCYTTLWALHGGHTVGGWPGNLPSLDHIKDPTSYSGSSNLLDSDSDCELLIYLQQWTPLWKLLTLPGLNLSLIQPVVARPGSDGP